MTDTTCAICGRREGETLDRSRQPDGIPLGPVVCCDLCGRWACPDCLTEADCCFVEMEDHNDETAWSPRGWLRTKSSPDVNEWERL